MRDSHRGGAEIAETDARPVRRSLRSAGGDAFRELDRGGDGRVARVERTTKARRAQVMKRDATTLNAWLEIATRGLRDKSRERIGEEMEAHYEAALVEVRQDVASPDEARSAALGSMGDPRDARRSCGQRSRG